MMSSLLKLQQRADAADKLLSFLRTEVAHLERSLSSGSSSFANNHQEEIERLRKENDSLKTEVDSWKSKLVQVETTKGLKQVTSSAVPAESVTVDAPSSASADKKKAKVEKTVVEAKKAGEKTVDNKKEAKAAKPKAEAKSEDDLPVDVGRLDLRVGKIVEARRHPDADSLYVEDVDLGEGKLRTVVSGLVKFIPIEEMQGRMAVLMCNLKPAKMRGVTSEAMVMCASTPDKVEILSPPAGSVPGDLVAAEGYTRQPDAVLNPKKKIWETVAPDLKTNADGVAVYKGAALVVPGKGNITSQTLKDVQVK